MLNSNDDFDVAEGHDQPKATIVLLPVPDKLKEQGVKGIAFLGSALTIEYKDKTLLSTLYRDDPVKTMAALDKMIDGMVDSSLKAEIKMVLSTNWLKHILTEQELCKITLGSSGRAEAALQLAKQNCRMLFVDQRKIPHAAAMVNDHLEVLPIESNRCKNWLRKTIQKEYGVIVPSQVIEDVVDILTAEAELDGVVKDLAIRTADSPDGNSNWYYDLTNKDWEYVEISTQGWKIIRNVVVFKRFNHQQDQVLSSARLSP